MVQYPFSINIIFTFYLFTDNCVSEITPSFINNESLPTLHTSLAKTLIQELEITPKLDEYCSEEIISKLYFPSCT